MVTPRERQIKELQELLFAKSQESTKENSVKNPIQIINVDSDNLSKYYLVKEMPSGDEITLMESVVDHDIKGDYYLKTTYDEDNKTGKVYFNNAIYTIFHENVIAAFKLTGTNKDKIDNLFANNPRRYFDLLFFDELETYLYAN